MLKFLLVALVIFGAGSYLTKCADKIAELTGWGRMFVGSLLLAGATSLPELMVDLKSIHINLPNLAVGDLLGSGLFNLLILSVLDFAFPSSFRRTTFSSVYLHHALAATLTIFLTSIIGMAIISKIEFTFLNIGPFTWLVSLSYLYGLRLIYLDGRGTPNVSAVESPRAWYRQRPLLVAIGGYAACALVILLSAPYLVEYADAVTTMSGLGHTFIGTTLIALTTSLPELTATLMAFRIGSPDLALGNIFGSNAFNMLLFLPLDFMYPGALFASINPVHAISAMGLVTSTSVAIIGQLYRKKEHGRFNEPSSEIVVVVIMATLFLLYYLR